MNYTVYLEKMTSIQGKNCFSQKSRAFKAFKSLLSQKFDYKNHKNLLKLKKPPNKPFIGLLHFNP